MSEVGYDLILAFDSDSPEFVRGFEAGLLYAGAELTKKAAPARFTRMIHANNAEMALRIAESLDISVRAEDVNDNWVNVIYETRDA